MPIIKSAKKKLRADAYKTIVNKRTKDNLKTSVKKFVLSPSPETLKEAYSALDMAAKKKVWPKQRADRKKSRLAKLLTKSVTKKVKTPAKSKPKS